MGSVAITEDWRPEVGRNAEGQKARLQTLAFLLLLDCFLSSLSGRRRCSAVFDLPVKIAKHGTMIRLETRRSNSRRNFSIFPGEYRFSIEGLYINVYSLGKGDLVSVDELKVNVVDSASLPPGAYQRTIWSGLLSSSVKSTEAINPCNTNLCMASCFGPLGNCCAAFHAARALSRGTLPPDSLANFSICACSSALSNFSLT